MVMKGFLEEVVIELEGSEMADKERKLILFGILVVLRYDSCLYTKHGRVGDIQIPSLNT